MKHNIPAARKFSDWQDYSVGTHVGVSPRYTAGIRTQKAYFEMTIAMMRDTHPMAAMLATVMLADSVKFNEAIINTVSEMMGESRMRDDITEDECWVHCTAIIRRIFHQLHQVRLQGAQAKNHSGQKRVGMTLWHMFQTHRLMQEFMVDGLRHHPAMLSVTTAHLDQNRVSGSTYAGMVGQVSGMKAKMAQLETKLKSMEGRQGNRRGGGGGGNGETP